MFSTMVGLFIDPYLIFNFSKITWKVLLFKILRFCLHPDQEIYSMYLYVVPGKEFVEQFTGTFLWYTTEKKMKKATTLS